MDEKIIGFYKQEEKVDIKNLLKRNLKGKITYTLGMFVSFMITGVVAFTTVSNAAYGAEGTEVQVPVGDKVAALEAKIAQLEAQLKEGEKNTENFEKEVKEKMPFLDPEFKNKGLVGDKAVVIGEDAHGQGEKVISIGTEGEVYAHTL